MAAIRSANRVHLHEKCSRLRVVPASSSCHFQMTGADNLNCGIILTLVDILVAA